MIIGISAAYGPSLVNFRGPLIAALVAAGHQVVAFAPEDGSDIGQKLRELGASYVPVVVKRANVSPLSDLDYFRQLRTVIAQNKIDVLLSYSIKPVIYGSLAASREGVQRIYSLINGSGYVFVPGGGVKKVVLRRLVSLLLRVAMKKCECVFFQNPDDSKEFVSRKIVKSHKVRLTAGSGVDLNHYTYHPATFDGTLKLLIIARLIQDKGILEFVEAVRQLRQVVPVEATLIAPADSNPTAIPVRLAKQWHDEGLVKYVSTTSDVRPFLVKSNLYVLPSYYREGQPRSILEAMAVGRAVVTANSPGCRETVRVTQDGATQLLAGDAVVEGENGFLVEPRNVDALTDAILRFAKDPSLIRRMGDASRVRAEREYDVRLVNESMLKSMSLL